MRKRILWAVGILLLATLIFSGTITALVADAEETPGVSIEYFTLSQDNTVYIKYAVDCRNYEVTRENTGMLFWTAEPKNPIVGTEESKSTTLGYEVIEGQKYYIFKYDRLSAAQMCDDIWARAYVTVDDKTYYSDVEKYSVETYAAHKLGLVEGSEATNDETLKELLYAMLEYGEKAQKHFPEARKDIFPTDILHPFTVTFIAGNGTDNFTQTIFRNRKVTKPENPLKEGYGFEGWFNGNTEWNFEIGTVTEDVTLTARWHGSDGLLYTSYGNGTCYVSGIGSCTDTDLVIPPVSESNEVVVSIGENAFSNCTNLTSIIIPDSVTNIGANAFSNCNRLIRKEDGVWYVDKWVIDCDTSVTSVVLNNNTIGISSSAFKDCTNLTSIAIPDSVKNIGYRAFLGCSSLTSITIPDSVTSIGNSAFYGCSNLTSITMSKNVTSIGNSAFSNCSSLTSITIPDSVTGIGDSAFWGCSSLTSITIPDSVTSIGNSAFSGCSNLTSITMSKSVTSIGAYAFYDCSSLTRITIPDSVTSIGPYAFCDCSSLTRITFNGTKAQWNAISIGSHWRSGTRTSIVYCTDGKVSYY